MGICENSKETFLSESQIQIFKKFFDETVEKDTKKNLLIFLLIVYNEIHESLTGLNYYIYRHNLC